jgi:hypothetical protein
MRRLRPSRLRSMATRTASDGSVTLTPRVRTIAGWLIAIGIIVGAAFFVGRLGSPDAPAAGTGGSAEATPTLLPIAFGTAIDPATGEVAEDLRTSRFAAGDTFAYSMRPGVAIGETIYVEVLRIATDASAVPVQTPAPQGVEPGAEVIAFDPPADALLRDFGPGAYVMRIYLQQGGTPIAEGRFELVAPVAS